MAKLSFYVPIWDVVIALHFLEKESDSDYSRMSWVEPDGEQLNKFHLHIAPQATMSDIVHEVYHLMEYTQDRIGADSSDSEVNAYLLTFIFEGIENVCKLNQKKLY